MSLLARKSAHEPVVIGLAGMVQEQPTKLPAGMNPAEIMRIMHNMQEIFKEYAVTCTKYANI